MGRWLLLFPARLGGGGAPDGASALYVYVIWGGFLLSLWCNGSFCYRISDPLSTQPNGECHSRWLTLDFYEVIVYLCHQWWNYYACSLAEANWFYITGTCSLARSSFEANDDTIETYFDLFFVTWYLCIWCKTLVVRLPNSYIGDHNSFLYIQPNTCNWTSPCSKMAHAGNQTGSCSCCTTPFLATKHGYLYGFGLAKTSLNYLSVPDLLLMSNQSRPTRLSAQALSREVG